MTEIKMNWNGLPLEMKQTIVVEMDIISRARLSMCSWSDNQLVRSTPGRAKKIELSRRDFSIIYKIDDDTKDEYGFAVEEGKNRSSVVSYFCKSKNGFDKETIEKVSSQFEPKKTMLKMLRILGPTISIDSLGLIPNSLAFSNDFAWFREKVNLKPLKVSLFLYYYYDPSFDAFIDWPANVKFGIDVNHHTYPIMNRFNKYENIVKFSLDNGEGDIEMNDEDLKKFVNVKNLELLQTYVTAKGFNWWLKKWLARDDNNEYHYCFLQLRFLLRQPYTLEDVTNGLEDFIEINERFQEEYQNRWRVVFRKNETQIGTVEFWYDELIFQTKNLEASKNLEV